MTPLDNEFADDDLGDDLLLAALAQAEAGTSANPPPPRPPSRPPAVRPQPAVAGSKQTNLTSFITGRPAQQPNQRGQYGKPKTALSKPNAQQGVPLSYARAQYQSAVNTHNHHEVDKEAAKTWIYPTNCAVRDYQFNIVQKSLLVNTLVALPTGLGKTLIAAVVMYNFFRWFPEGKIIFMAPTKPLVAQQIEACFNVTGVPQDATIQLTGHTAPEARRQSWLSKRVFFLTPQVMQNDLNRGTCPARKVVLLVVDEAHRATGNHAYCEVVRELRQQNERFRILALTATPGADTKTVQKVIENLLISRIEIRTEESIDIRPYIHERKLEVITVALSETIISIRDAFYKILGHYSQKLVAAGAYYIKDPAHVSFFSLFQAREKWRQCNGSTLTPGRASTIEGDFGVAMSLAQSLQLLLQHGIRTFFASLQRYQDEAQKEGQRVSRARGALLRSEAFLELMQNLRNIMGDKEFVTHPKMEQLVGIVVKHFVDHEEEQRLEQSRLGTAAEKRETRVMIFSQYRESVEEIVETLNEHNPLVKVMSFVGQSAGKKAGSKGFSQKQQLEVIEKFQSGNYNVLVATSIGEEGLDIGEVDLIVCYDVQNSPIRMLQRMGRTGRKRQGRVALLLTQGKEEDAHRKSQATYRAVQNAIVSQQGKKLAMYPEVMGRMLPVGVSPVCVRKELEIPLYEKRGKGGRASVGGK
ncbi:hypothetical protein HK097_009111, partial [Rhizophlyctis rosea]